MIKRPLRQTLPELMASIPTILFKSVLFPEPLEPIIAILSPYLSDKFRSQIILFSP
jgi:hypothetical protein